ncbi:ATP-binding protein [Klebsiella variicola]|uniref:ATP-binding protein n=1 Tax=Klebsiella variicola TaxID=244366 RepID=UPI001E2E5B3C|nr:ATP-binding protein [Klebsiella variicola]MCD6603848.1 ATP-binding protein [Klebsiella variicola subsp. variicola]
MSDVPVNSNMMFPAELTSLSPLAEWLAQQMASLPVGEEWRFALDLAACETATNIIRYALHEDRESRFGVEFRVADRRVTLRFTDAGETFPAERLALARGNEHFEVDPLAESGRGLRLILRAVDFFDVEMNAGKNITTLIKALPDPAVNYSTDKNGG